jgi:biotin carboxyl carrier protein
MQAPMDGVIMKVLAEDGDPVEYDQHIFEMQPQMASSGSRIK